MDTSSATRRGRNEGVYRCGWTRSDPGFRRRNRAIVEEHFAPGKNPCARNLGFVRFHALRAPIAQLDRASDYGSEGYRFNSYWVRQSFYSMFSMVLRGLPKLDFRLKNLCLATSWPLFGFSRHF